MPTYFLRKVDESDFKEIAELESLLWGGEFSFRLEMIQWKCGDLHNSKYKGAVALENGKIIGYRGIIHSEVKIQNKAFNLIHYTDAVVHPSYRGKRLLEKLNDFIMKTYENCFDFTFIFFPNKVSGHIYRKQKNIDFITINFFYRKIILPIPCREKYNLISSLGDISDKIIQVNQNSKAITRFELSKKYLNWKLKEPNRKFLLIESKVIPEAVVLFEKKNKRIEILYVNYAVIDQCLMIVSNYSRNNFVLMIDFPLATLQEKLLKTNLNQFRFRKWIFLNQFKKHFFSQKQILSKKVNENLSEEDENLFLNLENWNYQHIIYV